MHGRRRSLRGSLAVLLSATVLACGGPDICLQCPTGTPTATPSVTVTGTIASTTPFQNPATINVIICLNLPPNGSPENCSQSFLTDVTTQGTFTRTNVSPGPETIFFWVDADGTGTINEGDPIAQLTDSQGLLDDVQTGQTVTIANANINFTTQTATATITLALTPTPTPGPTVTPSPQPT